MYYVYRDVFLAKIERRVNDYKINVLNEPRPNKKLLVLDIDYTLFGKFKFSCDIVCYVVYYVCYHLCVELVVSLHI